MSSALKRLTALQVNRIIKDQLVGLHADGGGLYLQITGRKGCSWLFRYKNNGRRTPRDMGLGSAPSIGLAEARRKAEQARNMLANDIDPIEAKRTAKAARKTEAAKGLSFKSCAQAYIENHKSSWKNQKHASQWESTLERYVYPDLGDIPVGAIDVNLVLTILEPIWKSKTETASRVRGRIEAILNYAATRGLRPTENPAQWRGVLSNVLPAKSKVRPVENFKALSYEEIGSFIETLREQEGTAARALEFLIFTCARTGEVRKALGNEVNFSKAIWTIPSSRMKANRQHRVPLSESALALLDINISAKDYLFSGGKPGKSLSENALLALLKRMGRTDITPHGFRSTFRDWAADCTSYPREVCEMALAHSTGDESELAYKRTDLFKKRVKLMDDWAKYCGMVRKGAKVIAINR